jgi:hypothetical protein
VVAVVAASVKEDQHPQEAALELAVHQVGTSHQHIVQVLREYIYAHMGGLNQADCFVLSAPSIDLLRQIVRYMYNR